MKKSSDIKNVWQVYEKSLQGTGLFGSPNKVYIHINNAKNLIMNGLTYYCGEKGIWQPEYDTIVDWLKNNEGRGLWLCGECGRGKTLIGGKILPILFYFYNFPRKIISVYDAKDMNERYKEVISKHIIYIDDVGKESMSVQYGNKHLCFSDIVDESEKKGKLLIFSTNLTQEEMLAKYGERTIDRLKGITRKVIFKGKSLR